MRHLRLSLLFLKKDEYIIERFGKYSQTLSAGLNFIVPFIERVAYRVTLKEQVISVPPQEVISKDNAVLSVNAIAYIQVIDAEDAVYGVDSYHRAITSLCQTTLRSIIGTMDLDDALSNREKIKVQLKTDISKEISTWGLSEYRNHGRKTVRLNAGCNGSASDC